MWDYGAGNRGPELAAVAMAMAVVSVVAVALRSYTMSRILKRFVIEDYLAVFTCLLMCAFSASVVVGCSYGLGAHVDYVSEDNREQALIYKWAGQVAYIAVSTMVKFVIGIFLLRLCAGYHWQRVTIIVLLCVVGFFNVLYVFVAIFQCQPVSFYWHQHAMAPSVQGRCNGRLLATVPTYVAFCIGLVSDLVLALLPATLIKDAQLDTKTKMSVCCVLALGSLASVATIARIPYAGELRSNPDYLFNFTDLSIWSVVECGIAITASSLATLRPLFIQLRLLATSSLGHYCTPRYTTAALPGQTATSVTVVSSRGQSSMVQRNSLLWSKRRTSTALSGSTAVAGDAMPAGGAGLTVVKEDPEWGITVEKEFEMTILTKIESLGSFEQPRAAAARPRKKSLGARTWPPLLLRTNFQQHPRTPPAPATASPTAGARHGWPDAPPDAPPSTPAWPWAPRRPSLRSFGGSQRSPATAAAFHHHHQPAGGAAQQHQSIVSSQSGLSRFDSHATFRGQGLSAPPRAAQQQQQQQQPVAEAQWDDDDDDNDDDDDDRDADGPAFRQPFSPLAAGCAVYGADPFAPPPPPPAAPLLSPVLSLDARADAEAGASPTGPAPPAAEPLSMPSPLRSHPPGALGPSSGWL